MEWQARVFFERESKRQGRVVDKACVVQVHDRCLYFLKGVIHFAYFFAQDLSGLGMHLLTKRVLNILKAIATTDQVYFVVVFLIFLQKI